MADTSPQALSLNLKSLELAFNEIDRLYSSNVTNFSEKDSLMLQAKVAFLSDLLFFIHSHLSSETETLNKLISDLQDRRNTTNLEERESLRMER